MGHKGRLLLLYPSPAFGPWFICAAGNRCAEEHGRARLLEPDLANLLYTLQTSFIPRKTSFFQRPGTPGSSTPRPECRAPYAVCCWPRNVPFHVFKTETAWNINLAVPSSLQGVTRKVDKPSKLAIKADPLQLTMWNIAYKAEVFDVA